jgi:hypothetical protein
MTAPLIDGAFAFLLLLFCFCFFAFAFLLLLFCFFAFAFLLLLFCFCFFAFAFLLLLSLVLLVSLPAFAFYFYGSNFGRNYRHFGRSHKLPYINDLRLSGAMRGLDRLAPLEE